MALWLSFDGFVKDLDKDLIKTLIKTLKRFDIKPT
jgi:hypothetical protein